MLSKETILAIGLFFIVLALGAAGGAGSGWVISSLSRPHGSIRISQAAIQDINMKCSGDYRDLAANRKYVYANCRTHTPNGAEGLVPVTVENYGMRQ